RLEHGRPYRLTADGPEIVHDVTDPDPTRAFALSRLNEPTPIGVLRAVERPAYDHQLNAQVKQAVDERGQGDLSTLLSGSDTWMVR
ncbi:hypothetical protein ABH931_003778, partial [Streptacidiphilus sp. MAP12-33]